MSTEARKTSEIRWNRATSAVLGAICLGLVAVGGLAVVGASGNSARLAFGIACAAFFSFGAGVLLHRIRSALPLLVFSPDGVSDPTGRLGFRQIPWTAVSAIRTGEFGSSRIRLGRFAMDIDREAARLHRPSATQTMRIFMTTGSTPSSIRLTWIAISAPRNLRDAIDEVAPDGVLIS